MNSLYLLNVSWSLAAAIGLMTAVFVIANRLRRYDLVDTAWGWALIVVAVTSYLLTGGRQETELPATIVTILVFAWGVRLSSHIFRRWRAAASEDPRYVELRRDWQGSLARNAFWRIYMTQAVLATVVAWPVIHLNQTLLYGSGWWLAAGLVLWVTGFAFEVVSDWQLRCFLRYPGNKGRLMTQGLWRYSRHPNYFGELVQWWGIYVIVLGAPFGWLTIVGPLLLSYLIAFVSGIPPNERRFKGRPGWDEYRRRTSVLLPLPPKKV